MVFRDALNSNQQLTDDEFLHWSFEYAVNHYVLMKLIKSSTVNACAWLQAWSKTVAYSPIFFLLTIINENNIT